MTVLLVLSLAGCFVLIFGYFGLMILRTVIKCLLTIPMIFFIVGTRFMQFSGEGSGFGVVGRFMRLTTGLILMTACLD